MPNSSIVIKFSTIFKICLNSPFPYYIIALQDVIIGEIRVKGTQDLFLLYSLKLHVNLQLAQK